MFWDNKPFDGIDKDDLGSLIDNQVPESREIEYKSRLVVDTDSDKKEFLADISSFANTSGGYLIFGVTEEGGIPRDLCGIAVRDPDIEIRRLENLIRDGIEPRITNISMKAIPLTSSEIVILVRIPRSWALPHMISFKGQGRFYSRNSAGKYPLDVTEIRGLFALSESVTEKIKSFHIHRLNQISADETPVVMDVNSPKIILHLIPLDAFNLAKQRDMTGMAKHPDSTRPLWTSEWNHRFNFDGFVTYDQTRERNLSRTYLQIFRSGIIEAVSTQFVLSENDGIKQILGTSIEREMIGAVPRYLRFQNQHLKAELPIVIMISLLGVKGYTMYVSPSAHLWNDAHPIEKDMLSLPDVLVDNLDSMPDQYLRPIFDTLWNATGWSCSLNYDEHGKWVERF